MEVDVDDVPNSKKVEGCRLMRNPRPRCWINQLDRQCLAIDNGTYASLLRWCGHEKALSQGRRVHAHISASGRDRNTVLANLLVQMYGKCGSVEDARTVFNKIGQRNMFSWNFMIAVYAQNKHEADALQLYRHMQTEGVKPDKFTFFPILSASATRQALADGKQIHERIIACGLETDVALTNALVNMYGKCGSLKDARKVFEGMRERNVISWTCMIAAYTQNGYGKEALELFRQMDSKGIKPDRITFLSALDACASLASLENGRDIHERIIANRFVSDVAMRTALVNMYGKCGSLKDAREVFDEMQNRNVISWTAMIAAYAQNGHGKEALELYRRMDLDGVKPDRITFLSTLDACAGMGSLENGRAVHEHIVASGFESDVAMNNALVNMYGKCSSIKDARRVFEEMYERNVISWTAMITAYAQNGQGKEALEHFRQMDLEGIKPDRITFLSTLDACASLASLENGRAIHQHIVTSGFDSDVRVRTALVNMYVKCGSLKDARIVFDYKHESNVILWTAMISGYAQNNHGKEALELFWQMDLKGIKPDRITFLSALDACACLGSLENGRAIYECVVAKGFDSDVIVKNALVNMYGKCGSPKEAHAVFDAMHERDVISWNAMIAAFAQNGHGKEALEVFRQMDLEGVKPDRITFLSIIDACASLASLENGRVIHERIVTAGFILDVTVRTALVNMYGKCGSPKNAWQVFDKVHEQNVILWTAMIAAYAQNNHSKEALELFKKMDIQGIKPNRITFISTLEACARMASLENGRAVHEIIVGSGFDSDVAVRNALLNMYGKCGSLKDAWEVFDKMHKRDVISWNAMIAAYAQNGHGNEALELFRQMDLDGIKPDRITFLSILNACSHTGLLNVGWQYFISISGDYGVTLLEEHYVCMSGLLGRAGYLDEAEELIINMPVQPSAVAWTTLLGACRVRGDLARAERAAKHVFELDLENVSPYILLSNTYAAACRWNDAANLRKSMEGRRLKKNPHCMILS